jgi:hypothetical protein
MLASGGLATEIRAAQATNSVKPFLDKSTAFSELVDYVPNDSCCTRARRSASPQSALGRLTSMSHFVASPPIECRHARQRVSEECCRKALLLSQLLPAIAISQCQRIRPNARRELKQQSFVQDFGHRSPPYRPPCRSPRARQHLGQTMTVDCPDGPNYGTPGMKTWRLSPIELICGTTLGWDAS